MIGFLFFIGFIGLIFGPPILIALTPRPYLFAAVGWAVLAIALLLLDERNIPSSELGMLGRGDWLFNSWAFILATATIIRLAVAHSYAPDSAGQAVDAGDRYRLLSWQLPIATLLAVFFLHWLRNRMAGFEPAWFAHLATFLPAVIGAVALQVWISRRPMSATWPRSLDPRSFVMLFLSVIALVVVANACTAWRHFDKARELADGQPFCLLTFAGRNKARQADALLELSPLVSRWGGEGFERFAPRWLHIDETAADPEGAVWHRDGNMIYQQSKVRPVKIATGKVTEAGPCKSFRDGGISRL